MAACCRHLLDLVEFDTFGSATPNKPGQWPWVWGLDEIAWFASQPLVYRYQWLVYAAARVPQLAPNVYPEMPGLRVVQVPGQPDRNYHTDPDGQGTITGRIWRGEMAEQSRNLVLVGPPAPPMSNLLIGPLPSTM